MSDGGLAKAQAVIQMYSELIKRLRETSIDFGESDHVSVMMIEAADAIEDLITALTASNEVIAKSKPKWIPVTERLPEVGKKILVFAYGNDTLTARMKKQTENGHPVFECNGIFLEMAKLGRITHWMPLPQPPESEGE